MFEYPSWKLYDLAFNRFGEYLLELIHLIHRAYLSKYGVHVCVRFIYLFIYFLLLLN